MGLFIHTPKRSFEIDDAYVMALTFVIFFKVGTISRKIIETQTLNSTNSNNSNKNVTIFNSIEGGKSIQLSNDNELADIILACIANGERYSVKNPRIIQIIFNLLKLKVKNESLILSPNLMRFVAMALIKKDETVITRIGNFILSSDNKIRLFTRVSGTAVIAFVGAMVKSLPYAVLVAIFYYNASQNCGYQCSNYFEHLSKEGPIEVYSESTNRVFIAGNDEAKKLAVYIPSTDKAEITINSDGTSEAVKTYTRSYRKVNKKAKQVNFSDFKKNDRVLSTFNNLEEPEIPQKVCELEQFHEAIGIRAD